MLMPTKFNWKKMAPILVLAAVLVAAILYFQFSGSGGTTQDSDESVAELLPEIASLLKPQFDVNKIKNFDFSIFKDPRLLNFSAPPVSTNEKPAKGKDNPFEPPLVASSSETGLISAPQAVIYP